MESGARLGDCFDRIVVINLRGRRDRRRLIGRELVRAGMEIGRDGVELFPAVRPAATGGFRNAAVHGCYLSHLTVLRRALEDGLKSVLVLEDDLQLAPDFHRREGEVAAQLRRDDWDVVYLGHRAPEAGAGPAPLVPHRGDVELLHFYGVRRRCLERLVPFLARLLTRHPGHPDGGPMYPDGALNAFRARHPALRTLLAVPSLGDQRPSRSDLHPRLFDRLPLARGLAAAARAARTAWRHVPEGG